MNRTPAPATATQKPAPDVKAPLAETTSHAVLCALADCGTLTQVSDRLAQVNVHPTPDELQALLDEHVREYRVLCGAGGVYVRLPAGARAVANAGLVQGGAP